MGFLPKVRGRHAVLYLVVTCVCVGALAWFMFSSPSISSDVPCFDFQGPGYGGTPDFLLRLDQVGNLLIAQRTDAQRFAAPRFGMGMDGDKRIFEVQTVHRYDREAQTLVVVHTSVWEGQTTAVRDGLSEAYMVGNVKLEEGELVVGDTRITVVGKRAIAWRVAASRTLLAVLSANGRERPASESLIPFIGGGTPLGAYGQHFVEFFTFPELIQVGEPVKIPLTTAKGIVRLGLSWGGECCVCWSSANLRLCIIPTGHAAEH